jgi:CheY-like chemotaxis protein
MKKEKAHILVVDDEHISRMAVSYMLERSGYKVSEASSGKEALAFLEQTPEVDLVILDRIMPEMSGIDVLQKIQTIPTFRKLPIIMLTAHAERDHVKAATIYGVSDVVYKPVEEILLLKVVERVLREMLP